MKKVHIDKFLQTVTMTAVAVFILALSMAGNAKAAQSAVASPFVFSPAAVSLPAAGTAKWGIDISRFQESVDFNAVKATGISYVIIRCGYRGSSNGLLVEDPMFKTYIKNATEAGLNVGVYFVTQAVNEIEAVEEASVVLSLINGYNLTYPVFVDTEGTGGRAALLTIQERTAAVSAFCNAIQNCGYKAGVYASKKWFEEYLDSSALTNYKIWLAQHADFVTYTGRYDMWQYSSSGLIPGIPGYVDLNYSYEG